MQKQLISWPSGEPADSRLINVVFAIKMYSNWNSVLQSGSEPVFFRGWNQNHGSESRTRTATGTETPHLLQNVYPSFCRLWEIKAYLLSLQEPSESAAVKENVVPSASESSNSMSDTW